MKWKEEERATERKQDDKVNIKPKKLAYLEMFVCIVWVIKTN